MSFGGVYTALVTPFKDGRLDLPAFDRLLERQVFGGVTGVVVAGTTGESATLSADEKKRLAERVKAQAPSLELIIGTGTNATQSTIDNTIEAAALGADAALVVCPYYNRPTQEGLYAHFAAVHAASPLPIIAYNVPARTASDLLPDTVARLANAGAIAAIKEATGDMIRVSDILGQCERGLDVLSGDDFTVLPLIASGGVGVISVVSNVAPRETMALVEAARHNRLAEARALQYRIIRLTRALFASSSPAPTKAALALLDVCTPELRLPLVPANAEVTEVVRRAMVEFGGLFP